MGVRVLLRYRALRSDLMSHEDIKAAVCKEALVALHDYRNALTTQLFESTELQLKWLVDYFEGRSVERKKLFELTFGHYAVREIDPRHEALVEALNRAFYVAVKTREGLKVDLKLLGYKRD